MTANKGWNQNSIFQAILDRCPVGIAVISYEGNYVTVNPAYCAIYGYQQQEMTGQSFTMVFPEETRASVLERHRQFLDKGGNLGGEWTVKQRDGETLTVWSESVPFVREGERACRLVYVLDISDRKKSQQRMQIAETVYDCIHEAILVCDAEDNIIACNPAFTRLTGYEYEEVVGRNARFLRVPRNTGTAYREMRQSLQKTGHWTGEVWDKRKNGEKYLKELIISAVQDETGKVLSIVAIISDITERKKSADVIWRQANYDAVTGLPNRHMFHDRLEQAARRTQRDQQKMALILIDLDHFKEVNDTLGHSAGDTLLNEVATRIQKHVRAADTIARLGGDEFAVVLGGITFPSGAEKVASTLREALGQPFFIDGEVVFISASIGIAIYPDDSESLEVLFKNADQAMYAAKENGRNSFRYFTPALQQAAQSRRSLINDMRRALKSEEFEVFYQPIVHMASGRIVKAEALVRWRHPSRGLVGPGEFIPIAESTGLILRLGDWVARQAIAQLSVWRREFDPGFQITINQSPVQFRSNDFSDVGWFHDLERNGMDGNAVVIEITEGLLLNAEPGVYRNLLLLRDAGVQVAIDDFGTGYSSLSYLRKFDIDYLKIDRSFVEDLNGVGLDLCETIVVMAHRLGQEVVAEGVETEAQKMLLHRMGCDYAQGFLFSRPIPAEDFTTILRAQQGLPKVDKGNWRKNKLLEEDVHYGS